MFMNLYVGGFAPVPSPMGADVPLDGTDGHWPFAAPYRIFTKLSRITVPSKIFVFLDMREDRVNWSNFMAIMDGYPGDTAAKQQMYRWGDLPGFYHHRACGFSFADGHSEMHRWRDQDTMPPMGPIVGADGGEFSDPGSVDVAWIQDASTRFK